MPGHRIPISYIRELDGYDRQLCAIPSLRFAQQEIGILAAFDCASALSECQAIPTLTWTPPALHIACPIGSSA